jgi:hypothetical protein
MRDVDASIVSNNLLNCGVDGLLIEYIQFNGAEIHLVVYGELCGCLYLWLITARDVPHGGVYSVAGFGEGMCCELAKAARGPSDGDYVLHCWLPPTTCSGTIERGIHREATSQLCYHLMARRNHR